MLNQEAHVEVAPKLLNDNNNINHDPLNDHNYCSPNKRLTQKSENKANEIDQSQLSSNKIIPSNPIHKSSSGSETQFVPSSSLSPNPSKSHETPGTLTENPQLISKSCSNENLSDSSSSSSSLSSSSSESGRGLVIAQDTSVKAPKTQSHASYDTPQASKHKKPKGNMTDCFQRSTARARAQRARQTTSVTDKSEWIMGDDQIDSVLSEHLDEDVRESRHKTKSEHDSAYSLGLSSDYSTSDADSNQDSECNSEDDPDRLWCVCRKPHEGKFMIRCDICLDWFHGHCVGVTKLMSDRFERQGKEWFCGECQEKLRSGMPRNAIPKKIVKKEKEKKKKAPIPGKRGRGRPRKNEMAVPSRVSLRTTRKSSSSLDPKTGVDNGRLRRNLARSDVRSDSFDEFEDSQRLKELIKERKKEFFYKRHLAEQQKAAKRNELGLGRPQLTASLGDSLDSLATSTSSSNLNNLPSNTKLEHKERSKLVLQINTKKDCGADSDNPNSRIVTAIVRSPKKIKTNESLDPVVNDLFTAEPIQVNKKTKAESTSSNQTSNQEPSSSSTGLKSRKRSDSQSMVQKSEKSAVTSDQGDLASPKKKRKNSESSTQNGSNTPIGSNHIVQKIRDCLCSRSKQIKDFIVPEGKIDELAKGIEAQLNECFKEGTQKYLNKFRSLLFNLRDVKNENLVKNVLSGEIAPEKLVRMSSDEMASHELAEWRERENKHSIELIKRDAQLAAQQVIVKKTHKGEEVISAPTFTETEGPTVEAEKEQPTSPVKQPPKETPTDGLTIITLTPPAAPASTTVNPMSSIKTKITNIPPENSPPPIKEVSDEACWSGSITMPEIAKFSASARPVSGCLDFMHNEIQEDLTVCGRIAPDQVQGYIKKLRTTTKNQILMIQLFPLTEEDKTNFDIFFDYLYSRNRYGVIQTSQQVLKDFYVLPIHENSSIPEVFKPIDGPGLDRREPNCLLGLLIRNKRIAIPQSTASLVNYTPAPIK